jgi:glycosyltransferase involved in cell wall biosynthesis
VALPSLTINIAVLDEERRLPRALASIMIQTYPRELIDVVVVDGGSTDRTVDIAKAFGAQVVPNPARTSIVGRRLGCEVAEGELHIYMDADMEWAHPRCLEELIRPFQEEAALVGSFSRFLVDREDPPFNRCLSYHPLQQDPLVRFMSTQIEDTIIASRDGYELCRFEAGLAPVLGMVMFRTELLHRLLRDWGPSWEWSDVDFVVECARRGLNPYAYVETAGILHHSYLSPRVFFEKRRRDVRGSYLGTVDNREASYIDWRSRHDILRVLWWVVRVNLVLPGTLRAVRRAIQARDAALLYEVFLETVGTDYVLLQFVRDQRGRALVGRAVAALLRRASSVSS